MEDERVNGIAALLEQGRYLAAQTDAFPSTTAVSYTHLTLPTT